MVYHLLGHAAINADIFPSDEACLVGAEKEHHVGNVHRMTHAPCRLLHGIGALIHGIGGVNPTRRNGVHPCLASKAHCQGVSESGYTTLGCGVALSLRLAHAVARGGDIHDRGTLSQVRLEKFDQIEGGGDAYTEGILKLIVATLIDALHQGQSVVDDAVHCGVPTEDVGCKGFEHLFLRNVAHEMSSIGLVNNIHMGPLGTKLIGNTLAYAVGATGHDDYLVFERLLHMIVYVEYIENKDRDKRARNKKLVSVFFTESIKYLRLYDKDAKICIIIAIFAPTDNNKKEQ